MSIQFFYQKILGIFIILTMHVNLDLFSDIRKLFFHHDREFDVKTRGNFILDIVIVILSLIPTLCYT